MTQNPRAQDTTGICPAIKIEYEIGINANRPINGFPRETCPDLSLKEVTDGENITYSTATTAKLGTAAKDGDAFVYYSVKDKVAFSVEYFNFIESSVYPGGQRGWNGTYPGTQPDGTPGWAKPTPTSISGGTQTPPPFTVDDPEKTYFDPYVDPIPQQAR
jgi:hypothetical protein